MSEKSLGIRLITRFRGNKVLSFLLDRTGRSLRRNKWVFIIGCYNSGTTLLDQILSTHPEFSGLTEEGVMLTDKLPRPEDFSWRRMWYKCEEQMSISSTVAEDTANKVKRHWSHFYDAKKTFLIEKSISNTPRAVFFERYFQPAYFIHIVRNGYAVSEGIRRKASVMEGNPNYAAKEYPIEWCALQWKRSMEVVELNKPKLQRLIEITYEELTENPDLTLKKICDFVGAEPFKHSLKNTTFEVHRLTEQIVNMNDKTIKTLNKKQIMAINSVAGELLRKYDYYNDQQ